MTKSRPSTVLYAIGSYGLGLVGRILLDQTLPRELPFITFFAAVAIASYYTTRRLALLVTLLSGATGAWWMPVAPAGRITGFVVFCVVSGTCVLIIRKLLETQEDLANRDARLAMLNRELEHRIQNLFALTSSIAVQTVRTGGDPDVIIRNIQSRLHALAVAQRENLRLGAQGADLADLVANVAKPLAPDMNRLTIDGPRIVLPVEITLPLTLIVHELATNAVKYGAWSDQAGIVTIAWQFDAGVLAWTWRESGGPPVTAALRTGLGSTLIHRALPDAHVEHAMNAEGVTCSLRFRPFADH